MTSEKGREAAAPLEWLAAGLGVIIFVGLFAAIFAHGVGERAEVPDLVVVDQRVHPAPGGSLVQFTIHNRSDRTAAAVVVEGRVAGPTGQQPPSQAIIDYVPAGSRVRAGLMFSGDVRGRKIEIRPIGYREP